MTTYNGISGTRTIPTELAHARKTAETAWKLYSMIVDDPQATKEQREAAGKRANELDAVSREWYARWQVVGGKSNVESIVEEEKSFIKMARAEYENDMEAQKWMTEVSAQMADAKDLERTQDDARL